MPVSLSDSKSQQGLLRVIAHHTTETIKFPPMGRGAAAGVVAGRGLA